MEENKIVRRQVNTEEALKIANYKNERSLQRAVSKGELTVEKIPNPEKNNVRENYYFEDELLALKEQKTKSETIKNPQHFAPGATTPDTESKSLSPIVGANQFNLLERLTDVLESLAPAKETPEQKRDQFLTFEEAKAEFPLSPTYLMELWTTGKVTPHKGKRGKRLFSRKELENL
jgi:hypothetical protein